MPLEFYKNVGWGFLEAAFSMRADVAPREITGSSFHHCLPFSLQHTHTKHIHTHIPLKHSLLCNYEGGKFKREF